MTMLNVCKCMAGKASFQAKDQVGFELQHIADSVVYINGIDGSKWVC